MPGWMQLISFSRLLVAHSWSFGLHFPLWQLLSTSSFDKHDFDWFIYLWSLSHKMIEQRLLRDARVPKGRVVAKNLCYWLKFQVRLHLANFAGSQSLATTRQRHVGFHRNWIMLCSCESDYSVCIEIKEITHLHLSFMNPLREFPLLVVVAFPPNPTTNAVIMALLPP